MIAFHLQDKSRSIQAKYFMFKINTETVGALMLPFLRSDLEKRALEMRISLF